MSCKDCLCYEKCNAINKVLGLPTTDQYAREHIYEQCPSFLNKADFDQIYPYLECFQKYLWG